MANQAAPGTVCAQLFSLPGGGAVVAVVAGVWAHAKTGTQRTAAIVISRGTARCGFIIDLTEGLFSAKLCVP
jgi:hypothetical protein